MTEKDIELRYQQETGKYKPFIQGMRANEIDYVEWLERLLISFEKEIYNLKIERLQIKYNYKRFH